MDFNFKQIVELLAKYNQRVSTDGFKKSMVQDFLAELKKIGGYLKATTMIDDSRVRLIVIGETPEQGGIYVVRITDILDGEFIYKEDIAYYRYTLPTEDEVTEYKRLADTKLMIESKMEGIRKEREIIRLLEDEDE